MPYEGEVMPEGRQTTLAHRWYLWTDRRNAQTKAATMNVLKLLAKQLGPKGIRVNGVAPGPIWTPLQISGGASPEKYTKFGSDSALGRAGEPAELASIYVNSRRRMPATQPATFMGLAEARANHKRSLLQTSEGKPINIGTMPY
jgi:NAD(P)-dependent dehydrogenase (short-subunit alcohol dehydrogenase family)